MRNSTHGLAVAQQPLRTAITVDPEIPNRRRFLDFPAEIRLQIYRWLLVDSGFEPICLKKFGSPSVHLNILYTCRQIYQEACPILYSENVWLLDIWINAVNPGKENDEQRNLHAYDIMFAGDEARDEWLAALRQIKIIIMLPYDAPHARRTRRGIAASDSFARTEKEYERRITRTIHRASRIAARKLSKLDRLIYLEVCLLDNDRRKLDASTGAKYCRGLEPLTWLRHIEKVVFHGVPSWFSDGLASKMTQSGPADHLPKLFHALERYVAECDVDIPMDLMQQARRAARDGELDHFTQLRADMVRRVTDALEMRMAMKMKRLYRHDALIASDIDTLSGVSSRVPASDLEETAFSPSSGEGPPRLKVDPARSSVGSSSTAIDEADGQTHTPISYAGHVSKMPTHPLTEENLAEGLTTEKRRPIVAWDMQMACAPPTSSFPGETQLPNYSTEPDASGVTMSEERGQ